MPSMVQSFYLFVTLLGGVAVPLLFFVAVRRAVDCAFVYLESLGLWEAVAGSDQVLRSTTATDAVIDHHHQPNALVDGIILTGTTQSSLVGAVIGCTDPAEPQLRSLHRCTAEREPMRDAPRKGANHVAVLQHGDVFEVLQTVTDNSGTDRICVRLNSSGKVGWIRSSVAVSCTRVVMQANSETAPVHGAVVGLTPAPPVTEAAQRTEATEDSSRDDTDDSLFRCRNSNEVVAVERWFSRRGVNETAVVSGACAALGSAGYPPRCWQSELQALEAEGKLQHWIGLVRADAARAAATTCEDSPAPSASDVYDT